MKPGDQVRVTWKNRLAGFLPGDRGKILAGPEDDAASMPRFYYVAVQKFQASRVVVFTEDEIEPHV